MIIYLDSKFKPCDEESAVAKKVFEQGKDSPTLLLVPQKPDKSKSDTGKGVSVDNTKEVNT